MGIYIKGTSDLVRTHGLDSSQMALAFVNDQAFITSNLIGATSLEQLKTNIDSIHVRLSDDVLRGIEAIQTAFPDPCP